MSLQDNLDGTWHSEVSPVLPNSSLVHSIHASDGTNFMCPLFWSLPSKLQLSELFSYPLDHNWSHRNLIIDPAIKCLLHFSVKGLENPLNHFFNFIHLLHQERYFSFSISNKGEKKKQKRFLIFSFVFLVHRMSNGLVVDECRRVCKTVSVVEVN